MNVKYFPEMLSIRDEWDIYLFNHYEIKLTITFYFNNLLKTLLMKFDA